MLTWVFAEAKDIDAFYGNRPRETMRAIALRLNGECVGLIGLAKEPERDRAFSEYKPALEPYLQRKSMTILRAIKAFQGWLETSPVPVYAISEGTGILERVGFRPLDEEIYVWAN